MAYEELKDAISYFLNGGTIDALARALKESLVPEAITLLIERLQT